MISPLMRPRPQLALTRCLVLLCDFAAVDWDTYHADGARECLVPYNGLLKTTLNQHLAQLPRSRDEALRTGSALPYVTCVHSLDEGEVAELGGPVGMVGMVGTGGGGGGEGGGGDEGGNDDGSEEATVSSVFPIAFFRFSHTLADAQARAARERGWKETGWLRTSLRQPRCTGMLIAKLIAPENRMEAMEDDHAEPNIE